MPVPADAQQPVSVTHCEDVASLIGSVVGKESEAGGEIFNCGTNKMCSYDDVCIAAAQALGKEALVTALPPDTKSSFPFRPNAEGFAVRVRKVMSTWLGGGAKHNVLEDIAADGFYTKDFLALGSGQGGFGYVVQRRLLRAVPEPRAATDPRRTRRPGLDT